MSDDEYREESDQDSGSEYSHASSHHSERSHHSDSSSHRSHHSDSSSDHSHHSDDDRSHHSRSGSDDGGIGTAGLIGGGALCGAAGFAAGMYYANRNRSGSLHEQEGYEPIYDERSAPGNTYDQGYTERAAPAGYDTSAAPGGFGMNSFATQAMAAALPMVAGFGGGSQQKYTPPPVQNGPSAAQKEQYFEYSNCSGNRRAVLVGINYYGQSGELRGCINDVHNLKEFLCQTYGYTLENMAILTDDNEDPRMRPTKTNIIDWMRWLVDGAHKDDALFFHYSGHGTQVKVNSAAEADGLGEAICPLDFAEAGVIIDHETTYTPQQYPNASYDILVKPLPAGCRLTAIFDACHSGTVMNLPYMYTTAGKILEPNYAAEAGKAVLEAGIGYARDGDSGGVFKSLFGAAKSAFKEKKADEVLRKQNTSAADVIAWSGCMDEQTSADTTENGQATGAMSYAFVKALTRNPRLSYQDLLTEVRAEMRAGGYTQKPQLSACHPIDTEFTFVA